jgi:hypothetical protein
MALPSCGSLGFPEVSPLPPPQSCPAMYHIH